MATKRISGTVKDAEYTEIDGESEDISELDDSQEAELRGILNDLNSDPNAQSVYVKVFKFMDGHDKPFECFKANVSEMDDLTDRMRNEFGSGVFRVNVIRNKKLFKVIDLPVLAPMTQIEAKQTSNNAGSDLSGMVREFRETMQQQFTMLKEVMLQSTGRVANPTDPIAMMTAMMGAMNQMKTFVQPPQENNSFDHFLQLLEAANTFSGNKGDSNFVDVLRDGIKTLAPVIGEQIQAAKTFQQKPVLQGNPGTTTENVQQPQGDNMQQPGQMSQAYLIGYINKLVNKAKNGGDPALQAANILEDFSDEIIQAHLLGADTIDKLAQVNGEVRNYQHWFQQLQAHLRAAYSDEPDNSGEPST